MISLNKTALALSLGAMLSVGTSAFAQNVQVSPDGQYVVMMPNAQVDSSYQDDVGQVYPMMMGGCPYFIGTAPQSGAQNQPQVQPQIQAQSQTSSSPSAVNAQPAPRADRMPSLAAKLDMLDDFLQLNDQQQMTFGAYAQAVLNAHSNNKASAASVASAQTPQQKLEARIQNLKNRISTLENISKLRQDFISTLTPSQIKLFEYAETNPAGAMTQAAMMAQQKVAQQQAQSINQNAPATMQTPSVQPSQNTPQIIYFIPSSNTSQTE